MRSLQPRPRQDPVSCNLCRSKKLKCDRQWPCSNGQSRHLACESQGERPLHVEQVGDDDALRSENKSMKARLARLEQAVFGQPSSNAHVALNHASQSTAVATPARLKTDDEKAHEDTDWLEFNQRNRLVLTFGQLPQFTDPYILSIKTIDQIVLGHPDASTYRKINLPTREVAMELLDTYAKHLDAVQHIMHIDSTMRAFDQAYTQLEAGQNVEPGVVMLILAVCTSLGFYSTTGFRRGTAVFRDYATALKVLRSLIFKG